MPVDPSIPLSVKPLDLTNKLSEFVNIGRGRLALERERQTFSADVAQRQAQARSAEARAQVDTANVQPLIQQQAAQTGTAQTQYNSEQLKNLREHMANSIQQLESLRNDPNIDRKKVIQSIIDSSTNANAPTSAIAQALQGLPDSNDPEALRQFVVKGLVRAQQASQHLASVAPSPQFVNNGQQITPVAVGNPAVTGIPAGTPQGVGIQQQLPPNTPTMVGNQPSYVGANPPAGPVPSGPAIGQVEGVVGPAQVATKHYETVQATAAAAPTRIAALQTIMQEAPQAITSGGDWRRKILQQFGAAYELDTQTASDVLAKNLALIAQNAGNTDASRALAEMANPNAHMTKEAIQQTGQQLLGIEYKNQAAAKFFSGVPTNSPEYANRMTAWNKAADPRLFEYAALPDDQKAAWMKRLSPGVRAQLAMKARELDRLGVQP